ncbi:MAG: MFS transporter [Pseudomonadota bacterium]
MQDPHKPLTTGRALAYAGIGVPLAAIGLPVSVFLSPFYADEMGLGLSVTGTVFMLLRFWDLFTDPVMGYLVDRRPSRWGRSKHWLALAVPVLMIATVFLYMPGEGPATGLYLALCMMVLYVGSTLLQTPHQAWVPFLARNYDERSRLFMWREILNIAALLSLLILPAVLAIFADMDRAGQIYVMGWILLVSLPLTVGLALKFVPDSPYDPNAKPMDFSPQAIRDALSSPTIWRVAFVELSIGIAISSTAATFLFAAEWGFGIVDLAPLVLLVFFVAGFAAMPGWIWYSKRTEKHIALRTLCLFSAFAFFLYLPAAMVGSIYALFAAAMVSGFGFGAGFVLARSMVADLIEIEEARSGEQRAGLYYSLMTASYKTGASFAVGVPYLLLGVIVGFDPSGENSEATVRGLLAVFIGVPVVAYLSAAAAAWNYPVTRAVQAETASKLAKASPASP